MRQLIIEFTLLVRKSLTKYRDGKCVKFSLQRSHTLLLFNFQTSTSAYPIHAITKRHVWILLATIAATVKLDTPAETVKQVPTFSLNSL